MRREEMPRVMLKDLTQNERNTQDKSLAATQTLARIATDSYGEGKDGDRERTGRERGFKASAHVRVFSAGLCLGSSPRR